MSPSKTVRRHASAPVMIVAMLIAVAIPPATARANDTYVYNITGRIDGSSDYLIIHRGTVQWHHTGTVAAPGRQGVGSNSPTTLSASLNGVATMTAVGWIPDWSQPLPSEIRFDDFSSVYSTLIPPLPAANILSTTVTTASGRGTVTLEQAPAAANDYTLIAKFADGFNGADFTQGQITVVAVPEPAAALGVVALTLTAARRRRRGI